MKVRDPHGKAWRVTRRWVPWRRRLKGWLDTLPDLPVSVTDDGPLAAVALVIMLVLLVPFLLLVLVAGLEMLVLLLVLPFVVVGRMLFTKRWTVEARRGFEPWFEMPAGGWGASRAKIREIAAAIERGELPPRTVTD